MNYQYVDVSNITTNGDIFPKVKQEIGSNPRYLEAEDMAYLVEAGCERFGKNEFYGLMTPGTNDITASLAIDSSWPEKVYNVMDRFKGSWINPSYHGNYPMRWGTVEGVPPSYLDIYGIDLESTRLDHRTLISNDVDLLYKDTNKFKVTYCSLEETLHLGTHHSNQYNPLSLDCDPNNPTTFYCDKCLYSHVHMGYDSEIYNPTSCTTTYHNYADSYHDIYYAEGQGYQYAFTFEPEVDDITKLDKTSAYLKVDYEILSREGYYEPYVPEPPYYRYVIHTWYCTRFIKAMFSEGTNLIQLYYNGLGNTTFCRDLINHYFPGKGTGTQDTPEDKCSEQYCVSVSGVSLYYKHKWNTDLSQYYG